MRLGTVTALLPFARCSQNPLLPLLVPPHTMRFGPPVHFKTVQDNKELSGKYWHDMVDRLIETHGNTEIKRCGYTIRIYGGGPLHEPFFIGKGADGGYVIGATKKTIAIQALGEENILD